MLNALIRASASSRFEQGMIGLKSASPRVIGEGNSPRKMIKVVSLNAPSDTKRAIAYAKADRTHRLTNPLLSGI